MKINNSISDIHVRIRMEVRNLQNQSWFDTLRRRLTGYWYQCGTGVVKKMLETG